MPHQALFKTAWIFRKPPRQRLLQKAWILRKKTKIRHYFIASLLQTACILRDGFNNFNDLQIVAEAKNAAWLARDPQKRHGGARPRAWRIVSGSDGLPFTRSMPVCVPSDGLPLPARRLTPPEASPSSRSPSPVSISVSTIIEGGPMTNIDDTYEINTAAAVKEQGLDLVSTKVGQA